MNRKAFRQLLRKYLDGTCTEEEKKIVDQWYELLDSSKPSFSDSDIDEIEDRIWHKIKASTKDFEPEQVPEITETSRFKWRNVVAAIVIGLCIVSSVWIFLERKNASGDDLLSNVQAKEIEKGVKTGLLQIINATDTIKNLILEDGSSVSLYPNAKLVYPKHFAQNKREVYLDGDAFFNISKNPNRPFFVFNNRIVTQVLGTSFKIYKKNNQIEVTVKTGKVAVYENKEQISLNEVQQKSNGVIVTPNQKVIYYQQERHFITSIVDEPMPVSADSVQMPEVGPNYVAAPLSKVLTDLEKIYQLEIVLENEKIKNCLFNGDLRRQNLFSSLESICLVFNATYEIKGTKLLLKGGTYCE